MTEKCFCSVSPEKTPGFFINFSKALDCDTVSYLILYDTEERKGVIP